MKYLICLGLILSSTLAMANTNNPVNRCKRYVQADAFQTTIAQLCGSNRESQFTNVLSDQSCEDRLGKETYQQQSDTQSRQLQNEFNRIGHVAFCEKYGNRR